jgi:hypothetical protein
VLAFWQLVIGAGSGLFAGPNASAVMGVVRLRSEVQAPAPG